MTLKTKLICITVFIIFYNTNAMNKPYEKNNSVYNSLLQEVKSIQSARNQTTISYRAQLQSGAFLYAHRFIDGPSKGTTLCSMVVNTRQGVSTSELLSISYFDCIHQLAESQKRFKQKNEK